MAEVRVNCPTCNAELAIGEEHLGKEVECGSCLGAFVAEDPSTKKQPYKMKREDRTDDDEDRPRKKKRRRRDDDDEDDYDYSPPGASDGGGTGLAITSLILGILSFPLMCCCYLNVPTALLGTALGAVAMYKPNGRGLAITGLAINIISLVIFAGLFVLGFGMQAANAGKGFR